MALNLDVAYEFAAELVRYAGGVALEMRDQVPDFKIKDNTSLAGIGDIVTPADRVLPGLILERLVERELNSARILVEQQEFARDSIESFDSSSDFQWVVDPIDGSVMYQSGNDIARSILTPSLRPFTNPEEHLRPDQWGSMVGMLVRDVPVFGVVYLPVLQQLLRGYSGRGAFVEVAGKISPVFASGVERMDTSRIIYVNSKMNDYFQERGRQGFKIQHHRSYAFSVTQIAKGAENMIISREPEPYDIIAPMCILREAGGVVLDQNGRDAVVTEDMAKNSEYVIFGPNRKFVGDCVVQIRKKLPDFLKGEF